MPPVSHSPSHSRHVTPLHGHKHLVCTNTKSSSQYIRIWSAKHDLAACLRKPGCLTFCCCCCGCCLHSLSGLRRKQKDTPQTTHSRSTNSLPLHTRWIQSHVNSFHSTCRTPLSPRPIPSSYMRCRLGRYIFGPVLNVPLSPVVGAKQRPQNSIQACRWQDRQVRAIRPRNQASHRHQPKPLPPLRPAYICDPSTLLLMTTRLDPRPPSPVLIQNQAGGTRAPPTFVFKDTDTAALQRGYIPGPAQHNKIERPEIQG